MRLARSVVALAIVLATTTSHMTRTTYAQDATRAEVTAATAVTASFTSTIKPTTEEPLAKFSESFKNAAEDFMAPPPPPAPAPVATVATNAPRAAGAVAGNSYAYGTCTWYVKNRVPAWPNAMGNANQWVYSAQANGIATGGTPVVGAIASENGIMHVAYVESVSADKRTVTISEMNYAGHSGVHYRTEPASKFTYIYM